MVLNIYTSDLYLIEILNFTIAQEIVPLSILVYYNFRAVFQKQIQLLRLLSWQDLKQFVY